MALNTFSLNIPCVSLAKGAALTRMSRFVAPRGTDGRGPFALRTSSAQLPPCNR